MTLSEPIKIAIAGAEGRMGRAVAAALEERTDMIAVAGFDRRVLREAGLVPLEEAVAAADVVIDFTSPEASAALSPRDYDVEVVEAHHRRKVDAPSGTALMLGEAAAQGRGVALADVAQRVRDGITGPRRVGDIGFAVLRGGGIVGEHSVVFAAEDEILTFHHSARDRSLFARGAVEAARWVAGRPPGEYDMQDVLGLTPKD